MKKLTKKQRKRLYVLACIFFPVTFAVVLVILIFGGLYSMITETVHELFYPSDAGGGF